MINAPKRHKFLTRAIIIFMAIVLIWLPSSDEWYYWELPDRIYYWDGGDIGKIVLLLGIILTIGGIILDRKILKPDYDKYVDKVKMKQKLEKEDKERIEKDYIEKYQIPCDTMEIKAKSLDNYCDKAFEGIKLNIWRLDDMIKIISKSPHEDIGVIEIHINNINMYARVGDLQSYTDITGGGGGGTSIGGAIVGGLLAGEAGAVIGSRKRINEIKSKQVIVDKRETILEVVDENIKYHMIFDSDSYEVFLKLIPSKESTFVKNRSSDSNNSIFNDIKQLSELKNNGIITEEEFSIKKQQLLANLK